MLSSPAVPVGAACPSPSYRREGGEQAVGYEKDQGPGY